MTRRRSLAALALVALATAAAAAQPQETTMKPLPPRSEPLVWQGAADRVPVQFAALRVTRIRKDGGGLFGIGNSPSLVGALPDPRIIEATPIGLAGSGVQIRVPGGELPPALRDGSRLVVGLVDADHVICLLLPPDDIADDGLPAWARTRPCG